MEPDLQEFEIAVTKLKNTAAISIKSEDAVTHIVFFMNRGPLAV